MHTLIADCGSTKTEWAIINPADGHQASPVRLFKTTGFNAAVTPPEEIARLLASEVSPEISGLKISHIHFYGAGCIGGEVNNRLHSLLAAILPDCEIEIASDLLAAARALFGHNPGIACILGTGSNCGVYDGVEITLNTPPMGYILGDEGSGAVLGRQLINLIFKHPGLLPDDIIDDFGSTYHLTKADIIERVYRRPAANRFLASFCPFLKKHISHPAIQGLLLSSFQEFLSANLPASCSSEYSAPRPLHQSLPQSNHEPLPIGFVGSIAYHFSSLLTEACRQYGLPAPVILQAPLSSLISYHTA